MNDQQRLETLFDLTSHPGWKVLSEDLDQRVNALKEGLASNESTSYQLGLAHGHIKVYRELMNLRQLVEMVMKSREEEDGEAAVS